MAAISFALQGINSAESLLNSTAVRLSAGSVATDSAAGIDTVDLSSAMISLIQARNGVEANVKVAQTADSIGRSLARFRHTPVRF